MFAIVSLLVVLTLSLLITRVATVALTHTGLSKQTARFQARSALTGVGFTTDESEKVVNHPVRRKVLMLLMLVGNAGVVTAITSLILTFVKVQSSVALWVRLSILVAGLALLWTGASSQWLDQKLSRVIGWALNRVPSLYVRDFTNLLHLAGEYVIKEFQVEEEHWMADSTLSDLRPQDEGVLVLGINREGGEYIGAPNGETEIRPGDNLIVYGRSSALGRLSERRSGRKGDVEHDMAESEQHRIEAQEKARDEAEAEKEKKDSAEDG